MDENALKSVFREAPKPSRRIARADRTRAHALSPVRILIRVLFLPVAILGITLSIYIRTSPYEQSDALRHLMAMAGCETAAKVGLAPARKGDLGYHDRNDPDGDGIACGTRVAADAPAVSNPDLPRRTSGAKFLKP